MCTDTHDVSTTTHMASADRSPDPNPLATLPATFSYTDARAAGMSDRRLYALRRAGLIEQLANLRLDRPVTLLCMRVKSGLGPPREACGPISVSCEHLRYHDVSITTWHVNVLVGLGLAPIGKSRAPREVLGLAVIRRGRSETAAP